MAPRNPDAVREKQLAYVARLEKDVERYGKHVERDTDDLERSRRKLKNAEAELAYARQHPALRADEAPDAETVGAYEVDADAFDDYVAVHEDEEPIGVVDAPGILPPPAIR